MAVGEHLTVRNVPVEYITGEGRLKITHPTLGRFPYPCSCAVPFEPGDRVDLIIYTGSKPWTVVRIQKANPRFPPSFIERTNSNESI